MHLIKGALPMKCLYAKTLNYISGTHTNVPLIKHSPNFAGSLKVDKAYLKADLRASKTDRPNKMLRNFKNN